jgi:hypothetical protein
VKNWYAIRRRASTLNPTQGKFMYIPWDDECTLLESNVNRVSNTDVPSGFTPSSSTTRNTGSISRIASRGTSLHRTER